MCGEDQLEKSSQHDHASDRGAYIHPQLNDDAYPLPTATGILALALPTLGVLLATPVFLLLDTAVVGHVGGAVMLAALASGTTLYGVVTTQLTFLSYGTTARSARFFGQGNTAQAVAEGVQATWLAVGIGLILSLCMFVGAPWLTLWLSADAQVSELATSWLRVACMGIPLVLIQMAGNGWLRGIHNTKAPLVFTLAGVIPGAALIPVLVIRMGIVGSAWATVAGTAIEACCFLAALVRAHGGSWRPQPKVMREQLVLGRDLIVRSLSFQIAFVSAAAVTGRMGASSLGAHQVLLQLWNFLSLALDSLAIAAQSLVGAALGAGSVRAAKKVGVKVVRYSALFSAVLASILGAGFQAIPRLFTDDVSVLLALAGPWWQLVGMIVVGGVVFALDGVLLGAADAAFLRTVTVCAVLCGFLPGVWLALVFGTGLVGVWWGIVAFMLIRLAGVVYRFGSMKWAQVAQL